MIADDDVRIRKTKKNSIRKNDALEMTGKKRQDRHNICNKIAEKHGGESLTTLCQPVTRIQNWSVVVCTSILRLSFTIRIYK